MQVSTDRLKAQIDRAGYFPDLVWNAVKIAIAGEAVKTSVVRRETTMTPGTVGAHVTVLVLTPSRLIVAHVDDGVPISSSDVSAAATTESLALRAIRSVGITHLIGSGSETGDSVTVAISWAGVHRLEMERVVCPNPECEADHGYLGVATSEDVTLRASNEADGPEEVQDLLDFAGELSKATAKA